MRSKPDPVDQPERTAHYDCAMCIIAEMSQVLLLLLSSLKDSATSDIQHLYMYILTLLSTVGIK